MGLSSSFQASVDLTLWYKLRDGEPLSLADVPDIIPLRWDYFRDNWEFIKSTLSDASARYPDPDFFREQINLFSDFVDKQRHSKISINPFADSSVYTRYYTIFDNILINGINLTNEEQALVTIRSNTVNAYSKNDFIRIKNEFISYRDRLADLSGLTDPSYNNVYHRSAIPSQTAATPVDLQTMMSLQQQIRAVDFLLANLFAIDTALDPFALARQNANNPDIDIGQYSSGRLVKIEYGENLESLAARYLGTSDKWLDIAIANGLKPPYIDEVGQRLYIIANGSGNQINLAATDINGNLNIDKFYINQTLFIQSSTRRFADQRTIIDIRQIPVSGEIVLQLDGTSNLDTYTLVDQANIRIFAPNTINSSFFILIPSPDPLPNPRQDEVPWFMAGSTEDEKQAKIDLAVNASGELTFQTNGDLNLSYGLANAIQAVRIKMMVELGSLRYHPEFGLVNIIGSQNGNLDSLKQRLVSSITQQISDDPRFDRIENIDIQYTMQGGGNTGVGVFKIILSVRLAGSATVIPISFTVTK